MEIPFHLGPGEGRILMITPTPVQKVVIKGNNKVSKGKSLSASIQILDSGNQPVPGVVPTKVSILDPNGHEAEFSGYYGANNGQINLNLDIAPNDSAGIWEIHVRDLASRKTGRTFFRVE